MTRGQPRQDIAIRTRNWVWYWMIRKESGFSDDALESLYAKSRDNPAESLPAFSRIREMGSSPKDTRGFRKSEPVFDAVHCPENRAAGKFEGARAAFDSPFWELLSCRDMPLTRLQEIIAELTEKRGFTRIQPTETFDIHTIVQDEQLLKTVGLMSDDQRAVADILQVMDLDSTAMLAALYHESLRTMHHERALMLRDYVGVPLGLFLSTFKPPDPIFALLMHLMADRILGDFWATEHDWFEATGHKPSNSTSGTARQREINDFVAWYVGGSRKARRHGSPGLSLPHAESPALNWLRNNRIEINVLRSEVEKIASRKPNEKSRYSEIIKWQERVTSQISQFLKGECD